MEVRVFSTAPSQSLSTSAGGDATATPRAQAYSGAAILIEITQPWARSACDRKARIASSATGRHRTERDFLRELALTQPSIDFEPYFPFAVQRSHHRKVIVERDSVGTRRGDRLHENDRRFRELLDALPAAVYTTDVEDRITFFNEAASELWGQRPALGRSEWCGSWRLRWPDGAPMRHDECPMAITLREGRPVTGEAIAERPR